jgi:hypothetical protein
MSERFSVPVKLYKGEKWGDLSAIGLTHDFCGEVVNKKNDSFSFLGGHRVRLYSFKKNVHWRIPTNAFDISSVAASDAPQPRKHR